MRRLDGDIGREPPLLTLRGTPDNPVPPGGTLIAVGTRDDCTLRAAYWQATTRTCRGTVCLLQGRAEFIEKYYETIHDLRARGFAVVAFDWRGQGESDRRADDPHKGHVGRFDDYRLDLRAVAETVLVPLMPEPHVGLAHSMGGCVALIGALDGWLPFRRLVTVAPMLSIRMVRWPAGAAFLSRFLHRIGLGDRYI
ncbi:MAG: alpha/beta hydrolase, partial [Methylobacterium sp.]